jgi:hypothetical protein
LERSPRHDTIAETELRGGTVATDEHAHDKDRRILYARDRARRRVIVCGRGSTPRVPYNAVVAIAVLAFLCAFPPYFSKDIGVGAGYVAYAALLPVSPLGTLGTPGSRG